MFLLLFLFVSLLLFPISWFFFLFLFVYLLFAHFLVLRSVKRPFASAFPTHTLGQTYVDDHNKDKWA